MRQLATQSNNRIWPLLGLSCAIHLGVFGIIYIGDLEKRIISTQQHVTARLVRLGRERPKEFLPRKAQEAPTGTAKTVDNIAPPSPTLPPPKVVEKSEETKSKKAIAQADSPIKRGPAAVSAPAKSAIKTQAKTHAPRESAASRLNKLVKSMNADGKKSGSMLGTDLNASMEQDYLDEVAQIVRDSFELPSILNAEERRRLEVIIQLRIDAHGKLIDARVTTQSQRRLFDDSVINGAKQVQNFGPPPLPLRSKFSREGLFIKFCPISCAQSN